MTVQRQNGDGSESQLREKDSAEMCRTGGYAGAAGSNVPAYENGAILAFNLNGTSSAAGGTLAWQNTLTDDIIILSHVLDITTVSAGAGTISVGSATSSGSTANNMISAQTVAATATVNGGALSVKVAKNNWIVGAQNSGSLSGMIARAYFTYVRAAQPASA